MVSITLFSLVKYGKLYIQVEAMNLLIWPICIVFTCFPLAFNSEYGFCATEGGHGKYGTSLYAYVDRVMGYLYMPSLLYLPSSGVLESQCWSPSTAAISLAYNITNILIFTITTTQ